MDSPKVNTITEMQAKKSYEPKKQVMVEHFCKDFKWARTYHKFDHL